jgi:3-methylcrotonyl-CoA carboxylase alpha subunit
MPKITYIEHDGTSHTVEAALGDTVAKGDRIAVVEAMKMEHVLHAARAGKITKVAVAENQQVAQGALVAALE